MILVLLIVLNGVFAMSEIALVAARRARLMKQAAAGDAGASAALKLAEQPTQFMSTVQIGITSIGVLNGIFGEAVLAAPLAQWLIAQGLAVKTASIVATTLVVVSITYVSIVIGELVPKRIGQMQAERIATRVAIPMRGLAFVTRPFVWLLTASTQAVLCLLGVEKTHDANAIAEEIHALLDEGSQSGDIEQHQHTMVRNVFRLDERQLGALMVPKADVVMVDVAKPLVDNLNLLVAAPHVCFPVCDGGVDNIIGIVQSKQVLACLAQGQTPDLRALAGAAVRVAHTQTALDLLQRFRQDSLSMALVVGEYDNFIGVVTLRDLLEAVTGEFAPLDQDDAWAVQREDGSWLLDGGIAIPELKDCLQLRSLPDEHKGHYQTVAGLVMALLGRLPQTGDCVRCEGWCFEVVDMDGRRIDKVLASVVAEPGELPS
nr:hemolysin family protein [Atopomonas sediminilitoris]